MTFLDQILPRFVRDDPLLAKLFTKSGGDVVVRGLGLFLILLMNAVLARVAGVEAFGHYVYITSVVFIATMLARQGMDSSISRLVPAYVAKAEWGRLNGVIRWMLLRVALVSLALAAVGILILPFLRDGLAPGLYDAAFWGMFLIPVYSLALLVQSALRGRLWIVLAQIPDLIVRPCAVIILILSLSYAGYQIDGAVAFQVVIAATLLALIIVAYWFNRSLPKEARGVAGVIEAGEWRSVSSKLLLASGANLLLTQIDVLMLGPLVSTDVASFYSVASRISGVTLFAIVALGSIGGPMVSELFALEKHDELKRLAKVIGRTAFLAVLPIVCVLAAFGGSILSLFGEAFQVAYTPLLILLASQLATALFGPAALLLTMTVHEDAAARFLLMSLVANIVLNAALIPLFGMTGAAIATGTTTVLPVLAMSIAVRRRIGISTLIIGRIGGDTRSD
ncbi:MAG: oligosaccharide flippase family protein [Rhodobiaceae bacterium]|nr:oligosaccharide flippase family protein [Rhodobiaceae bacterium]